MIVWQRNLKLKMKQKGLKIDGGRVLMAITNTLMMVQAGSPTGICVVRSRSGISLTRLREY